MDRYLLLGGSHVDASGKTHSFEKGRETVVSSDLPLDEEYKGQFRRIGGDPPFPVVPQEQARRNPVAWEDMLEKGPDESVPATQNAPTGEEETQRKPFPGRAAQPGVTEDESGEDVTGDFEGAKDAKVKVEKRGDLFFVRESKRGGAPVGKEAGYHRPQDVNRAIQRHVEDNEE